jgi:transcriptional regulator with XRE-family HTH domain
MGRPDSPTVRRRELGLQLRQLRLAAGMTADEVASRMEVSAAKISRIETGARGVSIADLRFLSDLYGVPAQDRDRLLDLNRESKQRSWWQEYGLPATLTPYIGLEESAAGLLQYETSFVPPLLQTEAYARNLTAGAAPWLTDKQVEQYVSVRLTRQALLRAAQPPELWAIIDEAALHRLVGGPTVMREQLAALVDQSRPRNVTLQVIGFEAGAHAGVDSAFTLLQLREVTDVVYVEGLIGEFYLQKSNDLARYRRAFDHLRAVALSPQDTRDRIQSVALALPA